MPPLDETLATLPAPWPHDVLPDIQRLLAESRQKVVVLDDDPTGTQSVHGIPVLTQWGVDALAAELRREQPAFYILTNTRALTLPGAQAINTEVGRNLAMALEQASDATSAYCIISRSDSTLRGHFPGEVDALRTERTAHAPVLIVPAFFAGGRYTIGDMHYVAYGNELVPAGETEFARDAVFGYRASNLCEWVAEKTGGRVLARNVASVSLEDIRSGGPERLANKLMALAPDSVCVVNAAAERDLEVVALASLMCESSGKALLYRTAASFARARAGITAKPVLTQAELASMGGASASSHGGLVVVGSYVPKSSSQLAALLATGVTALEVSVDALLDDAMQSAEIERVTTAAEALIGAGTNAVIYTSRKLITGNDAATSLAIGNRVSRSLIEIVRGIHAQPRFVLAKGGITSSDTATKALHVKRAMVLGQLLPGVPVWQLGPESRYPNSIYVVFPGNVGGPTALAEAVEKMSG